MARLAASSLWPGERRVPLLRLVAALIGAPLIIAAIVTLIAFLIAGMSEQTAAGVMQVTLEAAIALAALIYGFTLTLGLIGIAILWAFSRHGRVSWAVMGLGCGTITGAGFAVLAMQGSHLTVVIAFALTGWAVFMLIRWIAGIGATRRPPDEFDPS